MNRLRMLVGYVLNLPGRYRRAQEWKAVTKSKNPRRVEGGKKAAATRKANRNAQTNSTGVEP